MRLIDADELPLDKIDDANYGSNYIRIAPTVNAIPLPDNATNGDVIKALFPHYDIEIDEHKNHIRVFYEDFYTTYPWKWWNAPYTKEQTDNTRPYYANEWL